MKNIVTSCDQTIAQTNGAIKETETELKKVTEKNKFSAIEATTKANESTSKCQLHQRKLKKFYSLKYKPQATKDKTTEPIKQQINIRRSYANAVKGNNNNSRTHGNISRKSSNINIANERPTWLQKLERLCPSNIQHQRAKSPTRIHSKTQYNVSSKDEEIENLKKRDTAIKTNPKWI